MKLSQIILEEYQGKLETYLDAKKNYREAYELDPNEIKINELIHFDTIIKQQEGFFAKLTQAYKDALYMEGEIRGNEEDRQVHLHDIMNDFMVRNTLSGSEAVELVGEHMKQFESMTLAKLNEIASKVEHPTKK